jgi:serine protease Do
METSVINRLLASLASGRRGADGCAAGMAPRRRVIGRAVPAAVLLPALCLAAFPALARPAPDTFADLVDQLIPAVVNISTTQTVETSAGSDEQMDELFREFFDRQRREQTPRRATSMGSGFLIDAAGYIVTNNHVVSEADVVTVRMQDEREFKAEIIGRDEKTDLALIKIESSEPLPYLRWGDSGQLRIGDWVIAIGNPFGLGGSVTAGILSARHRNINAGPYDDFLQTDASINRGNSGGPMFNMDGEVIGISTAIFSPTGGSVGIGFAIPASIARTVVDQLREYGKPRRGWLGVRIQSVNEELAEGLRLPTSKGALIANVTKDGPAEKAGIQQGDVVLRFDGKQVDEMRKLPLMVAETPVDKTVEVTIWRQGKELTVQVTVGELDETQTAALESGSDASPQTGEVQTTLGLALAEISPELREQFQLSDDASGVVVTEVKPEGPASEKGLQPGDVIVEVDQKSVSTPADVAQKVGEARSNGYRVVTLLIYRNGDFQWVALRIEPG